MYDVFYVSLLESIISKKKLEDIMIFRLESQDNCNGKEYKFETIYNSKIYAQNSDSSYLLSFYYLISWKRYLEKENIWVPILAIQYLWKLVIIFYKKYQKKPIVISLLINSALSMAKFIIKLWTK